MSGGEPRVDPRAASINAPAGAAAAAEAREARSPAADLTPPEEFVERSLHQVTEKEFEAHVEGRPDADDLMREFRDFQQSKRGIDIAFILAILAILFGVLLAELAELPDGTVVTGAIGGCSTLATLALLFGVPSLCFVRQARKALKDAGVGGPIRVPKKGMTLPRRVGLWEIMAYCDELRAARRAGAAVRG